MTKNYYLKIESLHASINDQNIGPFQSRTRAEECVAVLAGLMPGKANIWVRSYTTRQPDWSGIDPSEHTAITLRKGQVVGAEV
jgi:hypothetical protein